MPFLQQFGKLLCSLRLTVVLLGLGMILIFVATIAQVEIGIREAQLRYFRTWITWCGVGPGGSRLSVPLPGGLLVGSLLLLNLLAAHLTRFKLSWRKAGIFLIHAGVLLLLLGELFTSLLGWEARMTLDEGQTVNYSTDPREVELVIIDSSTPGEDSVTAIPQSRLHDGAVFSLDGYALRIERYLRNSELVAKTETRGESESLRATVGPGAAFAVREVPPETAPDRRDLGAAFVEIMPEGRPPVGRWLLSNAFTREQEFEIGGTKRTMALRQRRYYHPFSLTLLDFSHDRYLGTDVPKNFSSRVRIVNTGRGEDRETLIYMNHPLRYGGLTFYQSGFDNDDTTSILQVVRNPAWLLPYLACATVALGLLWVFSQHLINALGRRRARTRDMKLPVQSSLGWLLPLFALGVLVAAALKATRPSGGLDLQGFGRIPVVANGRVQPLDSLARNALLVIQGRQRIAGEDSPHSPIAWLAELAFRPDLADGHKIFRINHDEVLAQLDFTGSPDKFFSFRELRESLPLIHRESSRIAAREAKLWTPYEKALMQLARGVTLYEQLKHALARPDDGRLESELVLFLASVDQALAESEKREGGEQFNPDVIANAASRMRSVLEWAPKTHVYTTPSARPDDDASQWRKLADSVIDAIDTEGLHPSTLAYARMGDAYRQDGPEGVRAFNQALFAYRSWLSEQRRDEFAKGNAEALFNKLAPFYAAMTLYLFAFLLGTFAWIWPRGGFRHAAYRVLLLGFSLHTAGLLVRMALEGRPPVTNLYSSAVFIGWGAIVLSMILELIYRNSLGTVLAAVVGFATLLIAHHLSHAGDTLEMMRAVLDSNFWLATHVVVITLGYAATFLAGAIAIAYLGRRLFGGVPEQAARSMRGMVYGIICFATLASFVGTVLGGIWADQSWGRFWGWDPKENGALLIVLWNAVILHARWGGMVRERGMMIMAVFGNIVTSWSWFGTNMLGIGLHSYGFTDAAFVWLTAFVASQLLIMGLGFVKIPSKKLGRSTSAAGSGS